MQAPCLLFTFHWCLLPMSPLPRGCRVAVQPPPPHLASQGDAQGRGQHLYLQITCTPPHSPSRDFFSPLQSELASHMLGLCLP